MHNVGRRQLRPPSGELFTNEDPVPLRPGYTQLFIAGPAIAATCSSSTSSARTATGRGRAPCT